jgi:predicted Zn-dependent protease
MIVRTIKEEFLVIRPRGQENRAYNQLFETGVMIILLIVLGCATVPLTERKTLRLVSDSELATLSFQQYSEVLKKSKLSNDPGKVHLVKRVGERIARASEAFMKDLGMEADIKNYKWEFNLIEDDQVANAWCMPGGKVAVYTGILPITHDESGLAVVLGHEIAHAIAKHGNERMSEALLVQLGGASLSFALSKEPALTNQVFMAAYGLGANVGILLPYSRVHESEADRIGLVLMAKAGYDPRVAVPFWQRMNEKGGGRPPEFLSTHPAPETRIKQIQALIPEAMKYYRIE